MQFNSYLFIFLFLPLALLLYYFANRINAVIGKLVLIIASIIFYAYGRPQMLIVLGISILINYTFAWLTRKRDISNRFLISLPIIVNVGLLAYFKYTDFALYNIYSILGREYSFKNIILPLGISFYTFQQIAYLIEAKNKELEDLDLIDYLAYILFFPKLVMGPLVEPKDFITQLNRIDGKKISGENLAIGLKLFSLGLIKKVLIADTFGRAVVWIKEDISSRSALECMLLVLFYTIEIYFDFSGYTDMATGVSAMFNIELPINFDSPYKSLSVRDFWKRWHISLTRFLTKYIFIPLGGSRKGIAFTCINTMIVFLISGLWHGANWTFVLWGFLHGLLCCLERIFKKTLDKLFVPVKWIYSTVSVSILWLLFGSNSIGQFKEIISKIMYLQDTSVSGELLKVFDVVETSFIHRILFLNNLPDHVRGFNMAVFVLTAIVICLVPENNYNNRKKLSAASLIFSSVLFVWGVLCLGTETTFIYSGF